MVSYVHVIYITNLRWEIWYQLSNEPVFPVGKPDIIVPIWLFKWHEFPYGQVEIPCAVQENMIMKKKSQYEFIEFYVWYQFSPETQKHRSWVDALELKSWDFMKKFTRMKFS